MSPESGLIQRLTEGGRQLAEETVKLRNQILLFVFLFALTPLLTAVAINLPLVLERMSLFYHKAHLQNLRADFRDLDQHLASRDVTLRLLARLPEPGTLLGEKSGNDSSNIDQARARYTQWLDQLLGDAPDIVQIVFLDRSGLERFWLQRDLMSQLWQPTVERPARPSREYLEAAIQMEPGRVLVSRIQLDPDAAQQDPRRYMTLRMAAGIPDPESGQQVGLVMIHIDVGGLARSYRDTLWVLGDGRFLGQPATTPDNAFSRFPGLRQQFAENKPALWQGQGEQVMWVPMFQTEQNGALWVGRRVDPSPIEEFRNALTLRVLSIVAALVVMVLLAARWIARRLERFSADLTQGVSRALEQGEAVEFNWRGPQELQKLGRDLSRLSLAHGQNIRDLQQHARELEQSNRYKSQFLANVSHELRTPLNSILVLSKLLAEAQGELPEERQQQAGVINEAAGDLLSLIENILDLSRIEAGAMPLNLADIDLPELLEDLQQMMQPQFRHKGLELRLQSPQWFPDRLHSDGDKIRQVLKNFLSNALKFTNRGEVILGVESHPEELELYVQDPGIGIAPEQQEHIFQAFRQADGDTNRRYGGTGLGLSISRQLALLLGGEIRLQSQPGEGARFSLVLPAGDSPISPVEHQDRSTGGASSAGAKSTGQPGSSPLNLDGARALLISPSLQRLVELTPALERMGMQLTAATERSECLEALQDGPYDLVLLDTPETGACVSIEEIKQQAGTVTTHLVGLNPGRVIIQGEVSAGSAVISAEQLQQLLDGLEETRTELA